jgi:Lectin C-type domain
VSHNGHVYGHDYFAMSWDDAVQAVSQLSCCGTRGHLLILGDASEVDFFTAALDSTSGWIGLNDKAEEGTFVWTTGSSTVPFDGTLFTMESNYDDQDCGSYDYRNFGVWETHPCRYEYPFFVEFDCRDAAAAATSTP